MQNNVEQVGTTTNEAEGLIKTPRQLIITIILAFIIPIVSIILLVRLVSFTSPMGAGSTAQTSDSIAERIQPVAKFVIAQASDQSDNAEPKTGEQVYAATCAACHSSGVAGAPTMGNNTEWAPLIASGMDAMLKIALEGKGAMPARGGNSSLSDLEVARAVVHMANNSGGSLPEPSEGASAPESETTPAETQETAQPEAAATEESASPDSKPEAAPEAAATESTISPETLATGEKIYSTSCFACHTAGVAGAPKLGSKEDWAPYVATGLDTMLEKSITGVGLMPPRGGTTASDDELKAAIEYMLSTTN